VLNEPQELITNPDETDDLLRLGLHRLPIGEFPLRRSLAPVLASYDGAAELERGLDILLTGLAHHIAPPPNPLPAVRSAPQSRLEGWPALSATGRPAERTSPCRGPTAR
jgi:hypothetical protein